MNTIEKSVVVDVPVRTAYNQWTQFESFPQFMDGVESVQQQGEKSTHWRANIAGKTEEWNAEITEQTPDKRVAWRSTSGAYNAGAVRFESLGPNRPRSTCAWTICRKGSLKRRAMPLAWSNAVSPATSSASRSSSSRAAAKPVPGAARSTTPRYSTATNLAAGVEIDRR